MQANPFMGVFYHSVGGFASGSFYIPYKKVRNWAWESYWLAGGVFSWIIAPWIFALIITQVAGVPLIPILKEAFHTHPQNMKWAYIFGAMWGIGGLTFGLTMRYLGMSLGMAVALGFCAFFGTIIPPIYHEQIVGLIKSTSGQVTLGGLLVCLIGITFCGRAGISKERDLPEDQKKATIAEFSFVKGMWVAVFSGIMSACMAFGIESGKPMGEIAHRMGVPDVFKNTPVLIVVLAGGFTTNFIWCLLLNLKNRSYGDYVSGHGASITSNYLFSAIAGTTWYLQFFFYSMGQTKMGAYEFASWTLHMATIIIFSNMWGIIFHEWRGTSRRVHGLIFTGIVVLVSSTFVVGGGTYLAPRIVEQPANRTVEIEKDVSLSVVVDDKLPKYEWFKDGRPLNESDRITGVHGATLTIHNATQPDAGKYNCRIVGRFGTITSDEASLTVRSLSSPPMASMPASASP